MTEKEKKNQLKAKLRVAIASLSLWLVVAFGLITMLNLEDGIDGVILNKPIVFFGLLAVSVFLLATGLNNMISYIKGRNHN